MAPSPEDNVEAPGRCSPNRGDKASLHAPLEKHSSGSSDSSSDVADSKIPALPPDGGYGWVIVMCSFACCGMVDGMVSTFGVFQSHFVEYFQASRSHTAMVGSLMSGFFMTTGPLASAMVNTLGCRVVTIIGGLLTAFALVLATFSTSVNVLILTHGVLAGIGLGFVYLPSMVMVGYYFEKRRPLAMGISCSGAGVGMLILAPVAAAFLNHLDWKNSVMLMAGFPLQCIVLGALMRPYSSWKQPRKREEVSAPINEEEKKCLNPDQERLHYEAENHSFSEGLNKSVHGLKNSLQARLFGSQGSGLKSQKLDHAECENTKDRLLKVGAEEGAASSCHEIPLRFKHHPHEHLFNSPMTKHSTKSCHNLSHHSKADPDFPRCHHRNPRDYHRKDFEKPLLRKDIFYSGSICQLPEYKNNPDMQSYLASITKIPPEEESNEQSRSPCKSCLSESTIMTLSEMMDLSICTNPYFLILAVGSVFIQLAYFIPIMFIGDYSASLGIGPTKAASLISVMGISNTVGRALAGALANVPGVPALHLNNLSLVLAGVSTILVTLVCTNYITLVIYASIYGLCLGAFIPLVTIFLVKYLGLQRLTNAFGLLSMVRGLSTMAGPPIAGALLDITKDYKVMFFFAGAMLVVSGLVHYLLPVVQRWWTPGSKENVSPSMTIDVELESDTDVQKKAIA